MTKADALTSAIVTVLMLTAACGAAPASPAVPGPNPVVTTAPDIAAGPGNTWTVDGTSITGKTFSSPQAIAQALDCPVIPGGNGIPSFAVAGLYCSLTAGNPVMLMTFADPGAEQREFSGYESSETCMLVGPGWILWDTQPDGAPPCERSAARIGGTRADRLP